MASEIRPGINLQEQVSSMVAVDIRRMGKAELDELNRSASEWRQRNKSAQAVKDAIPEPSQVDIADPRETKTPPSTVGEQIELL